MAPAVLAATVAKAVAFYYYMSIYANHPFQLAEKERRKDNSGAGKGIEQVAV